MKITVLGGGSNFVPGFVAAMCKDPEILPEPKCVCTTLI